MLFTCLFGKPENVEALVVGMAGPDLRLERASEHWAPLPEALRLQPGEELYRVSRHVLDATTYTWLGLYRHAFAIGSTRPGGFYGAAIICIDGRARGQQSVARLQLLADSFRDTAIDPMADKFVKKLSKIDLIFDPGLSDSLLRPFHQHGGLDANADGKAYVDLSGDPDVLRLGEFIDRAQEDPRFAGQSVLYIGSVPRLAEAAWRAERTDRIVVYGPDALLSLPQTPRAAPVAVASPPATRPVEPARSYESAAPALAAGNVRYLVEQSLAELLPKAIEGVLPGLLKSQRSRLRRRRWIEDAAVTAALLLLFGIGVQVAVHLGRPAAVDRIGDHAEAPATDAGALADESPARSEADADAIARTVGDYFARLIEKRYPEAVDLWKRGFLRIGAQALKANFEKKYAEYSVEDIHDPQIDGDEAAIFVKVSGRLRDDPTTRFEADVPVRLTRSASAPETWLITEMAFGGDHAAADPERAP